MAQHNQDDLRHVVLDDRHLALGGRMVPFAGYSLPVQYPSGIMAEHKWTREHASLFDVSHMGPAFLSVRQRSGDAAADHAAVSAMIEPLVSGDIVGLKPGQIRYTLLLSAGGGIRDDLMIGRPADPAESGTLYVVVNAGTKEADFSAMAEQAGSDGELLRADDGGLLALQGPEAAAVLGGLVPGALELGFMHYDVFDWDGVRLLISRAGYTGEDGFEILVPAAGVPRLWDALVADDRVRPAGLGARDSLRLEAGLPLYGHDLDESVSPVEAGLGFAVSKRRREAGDFPGAARILGEFDSTPARVRVGLLVAGAPAREGADILDTAGATIGRVTSGGFSPTLGRAIAQGFVPPELSMPGTQLQVSVRGRAQDATVSPLPFVPHRYVRKAR